MSQLTFVTRVVLIFVPAFWLLAGCKPVADTPNAPLPIQTSDDSTADEAPPAEDEPSADDTVPEDTVPEE